jgi:hypothetical protein
MSGRSDELPAGIHGPDRVDAAYEPWRATGFARLRVGPDHDAPIVTARGVQVTIGKGMHFGRQSARNPACADHPPLRRAENGFVWGYVLPPGHKKSGWLTLEALEQHLEAVRAACGPAGSDFDRRDVRLCRGHCDGRPLRGVEPADGTAKIGAREVYLRWSPRGTAFRYLVRGDEVRRLCRWDSRPHDYTGVEVRSGRWAPAKTRGWVLTSSLR